MFINKAKNSHEIWEISDETVRTLLYYWYWEWIDFDLVLKLSFSKN